VTEPVPALSRLTRRIVLVPDLPAGEYFVAEGEPLPAWYPSERVVASRDLIITVHPDGTARLWRSLGVWEHV
jgi:hypothetical protein